MDASNQRHSLQVKGEACRHLFPCRGPSSQGIPSWRAERSRPLTFSFGFPLILWVVFHSILTSSRALTFCCPLYAISSVSFSFAPRLALGCSCARSGLFKLPLTRREMLLTIFLLQEGDHHLFFSVWYRLASHLVNNILNAQRQQQL